MMIMRSICVYCGASKGSLPEFELGARRLAQELVSRNIGLVYGGGNVGLMGVIADEVMRLNGKVTGVIPTALLDRELGHEGIMHLHVVHNMHERKALMAELSDGFIAMPGGIGTLEELFEAFTWLQLGLHEKPLGILNIAGYFDHLISFLKHSVDQQFLKPIHFDLLINEKDPTILIDKFRDFQPLHLDRWLNQQDI